MVCDLEVSVFSFQLFLCCVLLKGFEVFCVLVVAFKVVMMMTYGQHNIEGYGSEGGTSHSSRISDFGALEQSLGFRVADAANSSRNPVSQPTNSINPIGASDFQFGSFNKSLAAFNTNLSAVIAGSQTLQLQKGQQLNLTSVSGSHRENGGEANMAAASPLTDTSTDVDTDEKNQRFEMGQSNALVASDSSDRSKEKTLDQKTLRRLAQNREAARKSRLRKKAYVQQLESSRLKLTQLEQELQRARQQGIFISNSGDQSSHSSGGNGALAFNAEYARWMEEHNQQINELRAAVNSHAIDTELRTIVDSVITQFDDVFRLKGNAAKADVFHILSGMWKTPAERCFMWIGGFRSSELLKLLVNQLEPLTEQQLMAIYNLQQSSQQAEDALSQGMEALQQSLSETLASGSSSGPSGSSGNVANYMGQMAMAMGKLGTLEGFVRQHIESEHKRNILSSLQEVAKQEVDADWADTLVNCEWKPVDTRRALEIMEKQLESPLANLDALKLLSNILGLNRSPCVGSSLDDPLNVHEIEGNEVRESIVFNGDSLCPLLDGHLLQGGLTPHKYKDVVADDGSAITGTTHYDEVVVFTDSDAFIHWLFSGSSIGEDLES
ncbi:hypothetical protein TEA_020183 [Camellia sinensis var. sinensis]|uniref:BZIP domain-containing protein n=1 Tax=Camellia sinensis var. sinensis TaxID=542762 RepID=A0A4S4EVV6_CAMSN|nr:hypothetical protein TEA_020183 [Camellia sinensis var. sinensis]